MKASLPGDGTDTPQIWERNRRDSFEISHFLFAPLGQLGWLELGTNTWDSHPVLSMCKLRVLNWGSVFDSVSAQPKWDLIFIGLIHLIKVSPPQWFVLWAPGRAKSLQSCLTLCDAVDCSLPGSPAHEILQARILEWVAMPSSRSTSVACLALARGEAPYLLAVICQEGGRQSTVHALVHTSDFFIVVQHA